MFKSVDFSDETLLVPELQRCAKVDFTKSGAVIGGATLPEATAPKGSLPRAQARARVRDGWRGGAGVTALKDEWENSQQV